MMNNTATGQRPRLTDVRFCRGSRADFRGRRHLRSRRSISVLRQTRIRRDVTRPHREAHPGQVAEADGPRDGDAQKDDGNFILMTSRGRQMLRSLTVIVCFWSLGYFRSPW